VKISSDWYLMSDEELLDLKLRDLPLSIKATPLEYCIKRLYDELKERKLRFKPHIWLADEWFTPDGVPGFAVPFYLAHPRLMKLERKQMLEVEGGSNSECMRILRHEAGHAISNAFYLHRRKKWRDLFGAFTKPYPEFYRPKPNSRNYVLHLSAWYAQAHPAEDFAESFAIWLTPGSRWHRRYEGWPALHKLEYVDQLMNEIAGQLPKNSSKKRVGELSEINRTLRKHYERKRKYYTFEVPAFYDRDLNRIFLQDSFSSTREMAASFIRRLRTELCDTVGEWTGVHKYTIDHIVELMIDRCKELKLRVPVAKNRAKQQLIIVLTVQTMNVVHSGYHRIPL
jgi:hypothetical protein